MYSPDLRRPTLSGLGTPVGGAPYSSTEAPMKFGRDSGTLLCPRAAAGTLLAARCFARRVPLYQARGGPGLQDCLCHSGKVGSARRYCPWCGRDEEGGAGGTAAALVMALQGPL